MAAAMKARASGQIWSKSVSISHKVRKGEAKPSREQAASQPEDQPTTTRTKTIQKNTCVYE